ncbi:MAG TPA: putative sulfate exporter family transporter [Vicinamibacterales bacterium]|nr:putative sulfate exporter family transporter [Vicinamibacterales bacterium]
MAVLLPLAAVACLAPQVNSAEALLLGVVLALVGGNPWLSRTKAMTSTLLAVSVVGLGAGMNLVQVGSVGATGIGYTVVSIGFTLLVGSLLGRLVRTHPDTSLLITVGTAICGGSAIAAVAPAIRARDEDVSVSLGTVFVLNAVALLLFPFVGHQLGLTETQFGMWSALAIHDTSSVVGATLQYGRTALQVGTTIKLARALWIVPVTLAMASLYAQRAEGSADGRPPARRPWFILGFIVMSATMTWLPALQPAGHVIDAAAKRLLVVTLFLIGANMTRSTIRRVGVRPFAQGVLLWLLVASATLGAIELGWIR